MKDVPERVEAFSRKKKLEESTIYLRLLAMLSSYEYRSVEKAFKSNAIPILMQTAELKQQNTLAFARCPPKTDFTTQTEVAINNTKVPEDAVLTLTDIPEEFIEGVLMSSEKTGFILQWQFLIIFSHPPGHQKH